MEVSAKEGTNINILFDEIAKALLAKHVKMFGPLKQSGKGKAAAGNLSYDLNNKSSLSSARSNTSRIGGPGANRIEIVGLSDRDR